MFLHLPLLARFLSMIATPAALWFSFYELFVLKQRYHFSVAHRWDGWEFIIFFTSYPGFYSNEYLISIFDFPDCQFLIRGKADTIAFQVI